jgi:hypothetical protein
LHEIRKISLAGNAPLAILATVRLWIRWRDSTSDRVVRMATLRERTFTVSHGKTGCIETRRQGHASFFLSWWETSTGTEYAIRHGIFDGKTILNHFVPWQKDFKQEFLIGSVLQLKAAQSRADYSGTAQAWMSRKPQL